MSVVEETARAIRGVYETGQPIAPVRDRIADISSAYAVQTENVRHRMAQGRKVIGHKIGLTAKAVQAQLGVDQPDFGTLFDDMLWPDGAVIRARMVLQPRVEAEIAFALKHDLKGDKITAEEVIAATDYISPALEICGSRIAEWNIRIADTIADNASAGGFVLGAHRRKAVLDDLPKIAMSVRQNGTAVVDGTGEACLGNPAIAVAWLAQALTQYGNGLAAGDIVMSGALGRMIAAAPGQSFVGDFGDFGTVSVSFTD